MHPQGRLELGGQAGPRGSASPGRPGTTTERSHGILTRSVPPDWTWGALVFFPAKSNALGRRTNSKPTPRHRAPDLWSVPSSRPAFSNRLRHGPIDVASYFADCKRPQDNVYVGM